MRGLGRHVASRGRDLLGKVLCTSLNGELTTTMITETEAYAGVADKASHAYGGRRTKRTEPMFAAGGIAYVYLCYGIHHLFNVVTAKAGTPHAVLIRAGHPLSGVATILRRRDKQEVGKSLMAGPGSLACALGITTADTGADLQGGRIWIEAAVCQIPIGTAITANGQHASAGSGAQGGGSGVRPADQYQDRVRTTWWLLMPGLSGVRPLLEM